MRSLVSMLTVSIALVAVGAPGASAQEADPAIVGPVPIESEGPVVIVGLINPDLVAIVGPTVDIGLISPDLISPNITGPVILPPKPGP
jgi:hypothetical protein